MMGGCLWLVIFGKPIINNLIYHWEWFIIGLYWVYHIAIEDGALSLGGSPVVTMVVSICSMVWSNERRWFGGPWQNGKLWRSEMRQSQRKVHVIWSSIPCHGNPYHILLVGGGFKHFLCSIIYGMILPIDEYFSRWLKPPTSQSVIVAF